MINFCIFSKNRSLQLCALLESMEKYIPKDEHDVTVICKYDEKHSDSLTQVMNLYPGVSFVKEGDFKHDVLRFLTESGDHVAFLTDDIIFKEYVDTAPIVTALTLNSSILTFSLRLGLHISECYALNSKQPVPNGNVYSPNIFVWEWQDSQMDWNYPFSVDGHVFRRDQVFDWFSSLNFYHPNSFEEVIQVCRQRFDIPKICASFVVSRLVNFPVNRVQDTHKNRCGDIDSDTLLGVWDEGKKIDISKYDRFLNLGVHQEMELYFTER